MMKHLLLVFTLLIATDLYAEDTAEKEKPIDCKALSLQDQIRSGCDMNFRYDLKAPEVKKTCSTMTIAEAIDDKNKCDLEKLNEEKQILVKAAEENNKKAVMKLVKSVDVDLPDSWGETALMKSIIKGNTDIFYILIEAGADTDIQNKMGQHALTLTDIYKRKDMELVILSKTRLSVCSLSFQKINEYLKASQKPNLRMPLDEDFEKLKAILVKFSDEDTYDKECSDYEEETPAKTILQKRGKATK